MADRPNLLIAGTAIVYFVTSVALIFAGDELLDWGGAAGTSLERTLAQLLGATLFGLAMLNWMHRYSTVGGIFGRPLVVANLSNSAISALILLHVWRRGETAAAAAVPLALYALLAVAFGRTLLQPAGGLAAHRVDGMHAGARAEPGCARCHDDH